MGPACVPIFDECKDDEVPLPGGGCERVGVKECPGGLMGPPGWACEPIGPPVLCLAGWDKVAGGWCEPILPQTKCPAGTMEVLGQAACQPIGDCGTGTWGKIKTFASTIYVDQNHRGLGGKGTEAAPYKTIGEALGRAAADDHIAVAAGTYVEQVIIKRKVTLEGRCARLVTIKVGQAKPAVEMTHWANGAVLRGVTITGAGYGLYIAAVSATAERIAVLGCEDSGIFLETGSALTLRHSLVAGNRFVGIDLLSSTATVEHTVVRDTRERSSDHRFGIGVMAGGSTLTLRHSLVAANRTIGVALYSSKATVEQTVVRDTREQASDKKYGLGIQLSYIPGQSTPSELTLRHSLVAGNRYIGIDLLSSRATVEHTVVRDTREKALDKTAGIGIGVSIQGGLSTLSELTLRHSLVTGNRYTGIALRSSRATVEHTVVRDTLERTSDMTDGTGIKAAIEPGLSRPSELTLRRSLVASNRSAGITLYSSKATVEHTVVRDTRTQASDSKYGTGIEASIEAGRSILPELTLRHSLVAGNRTIGIALYSTRATVEHTVVRDTKANVSDSALGTGIQVALSSGQSIPSELTLRRSLVADNRTAGIALFFSKATVEQTVVRDTRAQASDNKYGNGIVALGKATLVSKDTIVENNALAGFLFVSSGGSVHRSLSRGNIFALDLEQNAHPVVGDDNQLVDNKINRVTMGQGLEAPPIPPPPKL